MSEFVLGQRWVVDSEPELGLGVVVEVNARAVTLAFSQAECERMYAAVKAPLTRILFDEGDDIHLDDGTSAKVVTVHNHNGLAIYDVGNEQLVPETALSGEIKMNQPFLRLMTGQLDSHKFFAFRRQLDDAVARVWQSQLTGLLGVRASLIDHQLYVAWSACERDAVRVLLADEVGLGKTIEAGMILARLTRTERVNRALILVPDALVVQWLVELVRRFNIRPEVYTGAEHDFSLGSIHLVPHSVLATQALPEALSDLELVVVDEAHRIAPEHPEFIHLTTLSQAKHCVLLTATPEQLGVESHFARLQLLDPAKFDNLEHFLAQEANYVALNEQIKALPKSRDALLDQFGLEAQEAKDDEALVNQLLDCHGVGRVMFRNTRASVSGFPARHANFVELENDELQTKWDWLAEFLKANPEEKVLVITHALEDVKDAEVYLWQTHGIDVATFHEDMDLIERDRAAAYFADEDMGSQVLICSEIGSEGRNFQFSHHLVCLDLPEHPDLLEQRIGRLDRIGQAQDVTVHVPAGRGSGTAQRFEWFHEVLNCIDRQSPAAGAVHDVLGAEYWADLAQSGAGGLGSDIGQRAHQRLQALEQEIQNGRDALLEKNSCRQPNAQDLKARIEAFEAASPLALVETASDLLNFHFEETQTDVYSLMPADNMLVPSLPGIPLEGLEVTFIRSVANAREDVQFLAWDSPFIVGLWELLHHSDIGSAGVALLPSKQLPAGQCLIEACFDVLIQSPHRAGCLPFLEALSLRTLVLDVSDKDLSEALPEQALQSALTKVDKKLARKIIASRKEQMPAWYHKAEAFSEKKKTELTAKAIEQAQSYYAQEVVRLTQLAKQNPNVSEEEIAVLKSTQENVCGALEANVQIQLSAIRLIVTTEPQR